jgi:hypothetical protein
VVGDGTGQESRIGMWKVLLYFGVYASLVGRKNNAEGFLSDVSKAEPDIPDGGGGEGGVVIEILKQSAGSHLFYAHQHESAYIHICLCLYAFLTTIITSPGN